jgi:hypothetical protein
MTLEIPLFLKPLSVINLQEGFPGPTLHAMPHEPKQNLPFVSPRKELLIELLIKHAG